MQKKRAALRSHPLVLHALDRWWRTCVRTFGLQALPPPPPSAADGDMFGGGFADAAKRAAKAAKDVRIGQHDYIKLHSLVARALHSARAPFDADAAADIAATDWRRDVAAARHARLEAFEAKVSLTSLLSLIQ
jgi:hypothetical protein